MNRLKAATLLAFAVAATTHAQTVTFLGMDTTTLGNWTNYYGQDGFVLSDYQISNPSYTGFNGINAGLRLLDYWSCSANHTCDIRQLNKVPYMWSSAERVYSYYYSRFYEDFQINTYDNATHRIALYFCDYEFYGRQIQVVAHSTATNAVLDTRLLKNHSGGVYLVYNYSGDVTFEIVDNIPPGPAIPNAVISGFFWGGSGGPPTPAPAGPVVNFSPLGVQSGAVVTGTVPIQVSLDSMPGVTSVQLQLDGQNLGAPMTYFVAVVTDQTVLPFNYSWDTTTATNCNHIITAIATDANGLRSVSPNLALTVNNGPPNCGTGVSQVSAPIFNPSGGIYTSPQMVSMLSTTPGAIIRYTTDLSTPTETSGTLYSNTPMSIASNTTLKAIAYKSGMLDSTVSPATYSFNTGGGGGPATFVQSNATTSMVGGRNSQSVAFNSSVGTGNTIFVFAQYYDSPVNASVSDTCGDQFTQIPGSPVSNGNGTAHWFIAKSATGGSCSVTVTYSSGTDYGGMAIFEVSGLGGTNVTLDQAGSGTGNGTFASASVTPVQPGFAIAQLWSGGGGTAKLGGSWTTQEQLRFSTLYQANIAAWQLVNSTTPLTISTQVGGGPWIAMIANFYVGNGGPPPPAQVAAPTFSPTAGTYTGPVSLSTATGGATIRYTTDNSAPSETLGTVYVTGNPITLTSNTTIRAIAYKTGMTDSSISQAAYTFTAAMPTFSPSPGPYTGPVSLATTTPGATIRYTTDNSAPSETLGTVYVSGNPITLTSTTTIRAIAYKTGFLDSSVAAGTFTIGSPSSNLSLVQSWATQSPAPGNSSQSVTLQSSVTPGNTIFVFAQYYSNPTTATATDNCNDTFTQITGSPVSNGSGTAHWFIAKNVTGGSCTVKVTYSSVTNYGGVAVFEVSGLGGLNATLDRYVSATGSGTLASASLTPTRSSSFAIAQLWSVGGGGAKMGGSWTTQEGLRFSTLYQANIAAWQILSSTAPVPVSMSVGDGPWIVMIANFYVGP
jgi:hypothetical protein